MSVQVETHTLALDEELEFKVMVFDNGTIELVLGDHPLGIDSFSDMVEFLEVHGKLRVTP